MLLPPTQNIPLKLRHDWRMKGIVIHNCLGFWAFIFAAGKSPSSNILHKPDGAGKNRIYLVILIFKL